MNTLAIPTTPQAWNRNPAAYVKHQLLLVELTDYLLSQGIEVEIPEDRDGGDNGIDFSVVGLNFDLKSFGLVEANKTYTWDSPYYVTNRPQTDFDWCQTDMFVHPEGDHPGSWRICAAALLRKSIYGYAPYYFKDKTGTIDEFIASLNDAAELLQDC